MVKFIAKLLTFVLIAAIIVPTNLSIASAATKISVKSVKLNKQTAQLTVGDTLNLNQTVSPSNATNKKVTWKSSNTSLATVDTNGLVKTKKAGTVTITVTTVSGAKKATCKITIKNKTPEGFYVTSTGIVNGKIADQFGQYGSQLSLYSVPTRSIPLTFKNAPKGTLYYALIMEDQDSIPVAGFTWTHWMAANIRTSELSANASIQSSHLMVQGMNDFGATGYGGPTPPDKPHTYKITVYALDKKVSLSNGFSKRDFKDEIEKHILGEAVITGTYRN